MHITKSDPKYPFLISSSVPNPAMQHRNVGLLGTRVDNCTAIPAVAWTSPRIRSTENAGGEHWA